MLSTVEARHGHKKEALVVFDKVKRVLAEHREGPNYPVLLYCLGCGNVAAEHSEEAIPLLKEAVEVQQSMGEERDSQLVFFIAELAHAYFNIEEFEQAVPLLEQECSLSRTIHGAQHEHHVLRAAAFTRSAESRPTTT
jgi:hypothetical protein